MATVVSMPTLTPEMQNIVLDSPGASAPDGVTPNYVDPPSLHPPLYATLALGIIFSTTLVAARIYTKCFIMRKLNWEDYSLILGWMFFMAFCGDIYVAAPFAAVHMWDTTLRSVFSLLYWGDIAEILYNPTILFVKISILLQYIRIFVPSRRQAPFLYWGIIAMIFLSVIFYTIIMFFTIFTCQPRELIWNKLLSGTCYDIDRILVSAAAFNLATDVTILFLPQYSIWRLRMAGRRKLGISAIFGLGGIACIVTALRVQSTVQLVQTQDASWYLVPVAMWGVAEIALAIMCSCLPVMPKFFQTVSSSLSTRFSSGRGYGSAYGYGTYASRTPKGWRSHPRDFKVKISAPVPEPEKRSRWAEHAHQETWHSASEATWYNSDEDDSERMSEPPILPPKAAILHDLPLHGVYDPEANQDRIMRTVQIEVSESRKYSTSDLI